MRIPEQFLKTIPDWEWKDLQLNKAVAEHYTIQSTNEKVVFLKDLNLVAAYETSLVNDYMQVYHGLVEDLNRRYTPCKVKTSAYPPTQDQIRNEINTLLTRVDALTKTLKKMVSAEADGLKEDCDGSRVIAYWIEQHPAQNKHVATLFKTGLTTYTLVILEPTLQVLFNTQLTNHDERYNKAMQHLNKHYTKHDLERMKDETEIKQELGTLWLDKNDTVVARTHGDRLDVNDKSLIKKFIGDYQGSVTLPKNSINFDIITTYLNKHYRAVPNPPKGTTGNIVD